MHSLDNQLVITKKGKEARLYFIECEKRANGLFKIPKSLPEAIRFFVSQ